jgi:hypothetical protein
VSGQGPQPERTHKPRSGRPIMPHSVRSETHAPAALRAVMPMSECGFS